ncbi:hypothetical protein BU17DRAFT_36380 [Hysterangium stoloniferum]|nr:hypothetical protein BU17DRAFT_36380 [Hysterangium stoloniferum]
MSSLTRVDQSDIQQRTSKVPEIGEVEICPGGSRTQSQYEAQDTKYKYAVFSFIHPPDFNRVLFSPKKFPTINQTQATKLGQDWADVRIDAIYSSDAEEANLIVQIIVNAHSSALESRTLSLLRKQYLDPEITECMLLGDFSGARRLPTGGYAPDSQNGQLHRLPGGESVTDVAERGVLVLQYLIHRYGRYLSSPPTEFANPLPDGVPHIVVVSHDIFLLELYEALLSWNAKQHSSMEYGNTPL